MFENNPISATRLCSLFLLASSAGVAMAATVSTPCSEQALIQVMPGGADFDGSVSFSCDTNEITLTGSEPFNVTADLVMDGGQAGMQLICENNCSRRFMTIQAGVTVNLSKLSFDNFHADDGDDSVVSEADHGGVILNRGSLLLNQVSVIGDAAGLGGGIYNAGDLHAEQSIFGAEFELGGGIQVPIPPTVGRAELGGGGIAVVSGPQASATLTVQSSVFRYLGAGDAGEGGAILLDGSKQPVVARITDSDIVGNLAAHGGGIAAQFADISVEQSDLVWNFARSGNGGAIAAEFSNLRLLSSAISSNDASAGQGGGLALDSSNAVVDSTLLNANLARDGGAILARHGVLQLTASTLNDNRALLTAGALLSQGNQSRLEQNRLFANHANSAGAVQHAVWPDESGAERAEPLILINSHLFDNRAEALGAGGIMLTGSDAGAGGAPLLAELSHSNVVHNFNGESGISQDMSPQYGANIAARGDARYVLRNSLIANPESPSGQVSNCGYGNETGALLQIEAYGQNLDSDGSCIAIAGAEGFVSGQAVAVSFADRQAAQLSANSPALDQAESSICADPNTTNARDLDGFQRPFGNGCDIGAREQGADQGAPAPATPTPSPAPLPTPTPSATVAPSPTPSAAPSATPTMPPDGGATSTPSPQPTLSPTASPAPTASASPVPSASPSSTAAPESSPQAESQAGSGALGGALMWLACCGLIRRRWRRGVVNSPHR